MMKIIKTVILLAVALCIMAPAFAQSASADDTAYNMQILREKLKADKKLVVAANMQLTEAEAKAFWPVYEAYQKGLDVINRRTVEMIKTYADDWNAKTMDNEKARKMISTFISIQMDEMLMMQSYSWELNSLLPSTKVARYLQIENKIRAIIKYELAAQIPLIEGK
jgi:Spy/CpxP family protein refolding chaperone